MSAYFFWGRVSLSPLSPSTFSQHVEHLVPFPEGYGATVHFYWPDKGFQLLGMSVAFSGVVGVYF
jgi:Protein of unknown function (DUF775)